MSQFVVFFFFDGNVFTAPFSLRTIGTKTKLFQSVVRSLSPIVPPLSVSHTRVLFLDSPEQAPGTKLGSKSSSNTGSIVGGVVGGMAIISLVIAIGFFLRRRRRAPVVCVSKRPMDEIQQPSKMDDRYTASTGIPGTIGSSSMPGTPAVPVRIYVSVSCPIFRPRLALLYICAHRIPILAILFIFIFLTLRNRMIHLHFLGTKEFRGHRPRLKEPYFRSMEQGTPLPRCRPHGHKVTTAYLLYMSEFGVYSVILSI